MADTEAAVLLETEPETPAEALAERERDDAVIEAELLVEDVSIDGMCGVY
jgi:mycofactocin precursor